MKTGQRINKDYIAGKQVKSLDELWDLLNSKKVIYARHRLYPTAFFHSWCLKTAKSWIDQGYFYSVIKIPSP